MNGSPRVLPLIGGIVALLGALVSLAALFPDYYDDASPAGWSRARGGSWCSS